MIIYCNKLIDVFNRYTNIKNIIPNNSMTRDKKNKSLILLFIVIVFILLVSETKEYFKIFIIFIIFFLIYRKINKDENFDHSAQFPLYQKIPDIINKKNINNDKQHKNINLLNQINSYANINYNAENIDKFTKWCYPNTSICKNNPKKCNV